MRLFLVFVLLLASRLIFSQIYIDHLNNDCPVPDQLTVCLGDNTNYVGSYQFITYDNFCADTISGTLRIFRNERGEFFLDDFSFGTWSACYDIDPPKGTLRLFVSCSSFDGISGTDNYGDVWTSENIRYTGSSVILDWSNSYGEFGTTELIPMDGRPLNGPADYLESEYSFEWSTGETSQTIYIDEPGKYTVQVEGPEFNDATQYIVDEEFNTFDSICSEHILDVRYFMDHNGNGIWDNNETAVLTGQKYISIEPAYESLAFEGAYHERYVLDAKKYTINDDSELFNILNLPLQVNAADIRGLQFLEIGLIPEQALNEVDMEISTNRVTRCNRSVDFFLRIRNTGSQAYNKTVTVSYDPLMEFEDASQSPVDKTESSVSFNVILDNHGEEKIIRMSFLLPSADYIGEIFCLDPSDDLNQKSDDSYCFELTCAYDPNDKHGTPFRGERNLTLFDEELKYTIRFENLGNDTAFDVRIEDPLSSTLNPESYRFIQSSHPLTRNYITASGKLIFEFKNIQLPSIAQDSVANKGFVQFAISTVEGLREEDQVENHAGIYFDFNDPVITNTTRHTMVSTLGTSSSGLTQKAEAPKIYPNPGHDIYYTDYPLGSSSVIYITDKLGKLVMKKTGPSRELDLSHVDPGVYFIQIMDENKRTGVTRIIKI